MTHRLSNYTAPNARKNLQLNWIWQAVASFDVLFISCSIYAYKSIWSQLDTYWVINSSWITWTEHRTRLEEMTNVCKILYENLSGTFRMWELIVLEGQLKHIWTKWGMKVRTGLNKLRIGSSTHDNNSTKAGKSPIGWVSMNFQGTLYKMTLVNCIHGSPRYFTFFCMSPIEYSKLSLVQLQLIRIETWKI
jgi:hypothetical protein